MSAITGKTAKKQYALAAEAQARQEARLAEDKSKVEAIEAGQRLVRTGGRGMLAFVDGDLAATMGGTTGDDTRKGLRGLFGAGSDMIGSAR